MIHEELRAALEFVEQFAEGGMESNRLWTTRSEIRDVTWDDYPQELWTVFQYLTDQKTWTTARIWRWVTQPGLNKLRGNTPVDEKAHLAELVRDIFGNPFRPVAFDPAWRTSDVVALAQGIYDDRAFDRMPILADALQDAGCINDDILNHCRQPGEHARGCWVVDLILGKS